MPLRPDVLRPRELDLVALTKSALRPTVDRALARLGIASIRRLLTSSAVLALLRQGIATSGEAAISKLTTVERAKGIVMARTGCDEERATAVLRVGAKRSGRTVRDMANELIARAAAGEYRGETA
jgi:AmiR/NasT family two-component response regulator